MLGVHLFVIPWWVNTLYFGAVGAIGLWKGDWRARLLGGYMALTTAAETVIWFAFIKGASWLDFRRSLLVDSVMLLLCLICAARARGYWVIWATSIAMVGVISDLMSVAFGLTWWAWASASLMWSYAQGAVILWGVATARDRDLRPHVALKTATD